MSPAFIPPLAVLGLLVLVMWFRLHAFLALLVVSLCVGMSTDMTATQVLDATERGMSSP
jgi:H+/gluconate symporter-like permease